MTDTTRGADDDASPGTTAASGPVPDGTDVDQRGSPQLDAATRTFLHALANEQRQQLLALFTGGAELTVSRVAERLKISQPTASQRLALLRRGGVLAARRDGRQVRYRVDAHAVERSLTELRTYLCARRPLPGNRSD
jgi:DNA-binding transcriptional ArsR family regulator